MSIKRMMLLVEVARAGSISAAARMLHYTPSAISQQIALLESEIGHDLVQRSARGARLTDAGRTIVRHAERIERIHEAAHREVRALEDLRGGSLHLGTFPTCSEGLLPDVIARFRARAPEVGIEVESGTRNELRLRLESGEIELAFLWDYASAPLQPTPDEEFAHLTDDPIVLLAPRGLRDVDTEVAIETLADHRWIARSEAPNRALLTTSLATAGLSTEPPTLAKTYAELQAFVAAGLGLAIVPSMATTTLRHDLTATPIRGAEPRRLWFATRRHSRLSPAAAAMNAVLRSFAAEHRQG